MSGDGKKGRAMENTSTASANRLAFVGAAAIIGALIAGGSAWFSARPGTSVHAAQLSSAPPQAPKASKTAFNTTPSEFVSRFNTVMSEIDRTLLLPPATNLQRQPMSETTTLFHDLRGNVRVYSDIDPSTGKPLAFGILGMGDGQVDSATNMMAAVVALGGAVFGAKTNGQREFISLCGRGGRASADKPASPMVVDGVKTVCVIEQGLLMAKLTAIGQ
jgi:hypothetical protein